MAGQPTTGTDITSLPILFDDDFEESVLDPDVWAFDIREGVIVFEDAEETNSVMQVGHELQWSDITLLRGDRWRNYILELDVKLLNYVDGADNFFVTVRHDETQGEYEASLDLARRLVTLSSTVDGIWRGVAAQAPLVLDLSTWYRIKIHVEDNYIGFFLNDELITQLTDDTLSQGSMRLLAAPGSLVMVDNVAIHEIPSFADQHDLLLTEFAFRDNNPQWFEIFNDSGRHIKLAGLEITNGSESYIINDDA
ncbi:MAG TPA: hypothetical protein VJZ27_11670, partial [Aggregatilineales bacterium]|nr:hypothetical protein [Aggregatilineales bacterium]